MTTRNDIKIKATALALTASLMLGSSGYLYYDNNTIKDLNQKQKSEINSLSEARTLLQRELAGARTQLEQYKGKNAELDRLIAASEKEIQVKEVRIRTLISANASLKHFQKEAVELRKLNQKHLAKINDLEATLLGLTHQNQMLLTDNQQLKSRLAQLEERNLFLENKMVIASALKADNIFITGEKKTKSGVYTKSKLKKADRFLVAFELTENKVADAGEKTFHVRVLDPKGNLILNSESDAFQNLDQNLRLSFTSRHTVNYSNSKQKVLIPVGLGAFEVTRGAYTVELYCNGHFCGIKKLNIK